MRIAAISDIHGRIRDLECPEGVDVIIIAGDICPDFPNDPVNLQAKWLKTKFAAMLHDFVESNPYVTIYMTWGNHDWTQAMLREIEDSWPANVYCVVDAWVPIGGKKVWFSPWVQKLGGWAWNQSDTKAFERYSKIPDDIDIIVSHAPPYGAGDSIAASRFKYGLISEPNDHIGSWELSFWARKNKNLQLIICGHIHEDRGTHQLEHIKVVNVASVDEAYERYPERWTILEI